MAHFCFANQKLHHTNNINEEFHTIVSYSSVLHKTIGYALMSIQSTLMILR